MLSEVINGSALLYGNDWKKRTDKMFLISQTGSTAVDGLSIGNARQRSEYIHVLTALYLLAVYFIFLLAETRRHKSLFVGTIRRHEEFSLDFHKATLMTRCSVER